MAHSNKSITFDMDLFPSQDNVYSLGNNEQRWKIFGSNIVNGNIRAFYGTCDVAAATAIKNVVCPGYNTPLIGDLLIVTFTNTNSAGVSTLKLTLNNSDTQISIKKMYNAGLANLTAAGELHKDTAALFLYNGTYWLLCNGDYNSNTYDRINLNNNKKAKSAIRAGAVCVGDSNGYCEIGENVSFDITYPILFASAAIKANAAAANLYLFYPSITNTNNTTGLTHVANGILYLTGTLSGNIFTCNSNTLTYTIPTTADNLIYIPVGINTNGTSQSYYFLGGIPQLYAFYNDAFQKISGHSFTTNNLLTGHTLQVDLTSTSASTAFNGSADINDIGVNGILAVGNGGTGTSTAPTSYGIIYAADSDTYTCTTAGASGQLLIGKGNNAAPDWYAGLTLAGDGSSNSPYTATFSNNVTINGALQFGNNDTYGDIYTPIYWTNGTPAETAVVQRYNFTIAANSNTTTITLSNTNKARTIVTSIVVEYSSIQNLISPISWDINSSGNIVLTTNGNVSAAVSGYILTAIGPAAS